MNPYQDYVESLELAYKKAERYTVTGAHPVEPSTEPSVESRASKLLLFSPHPDDECITGLFALRAMRELDVEVINVPVTFGSDRTSRERRLDELERACAYLSWSNHVARSDLSDLDVEDIAETLCVFQPSVIVYPHKLDGHSTHEAVHTLVEEALGQMPENFECLLVETEFWRAMENPNLMLEGDSATLAELITALSLHHGEVSRNPYHLSLPAWMLDNTRRGTELIGGKGARASACHFTTLYHVSQWVSQEKSNLLDGGMTISMSDSLASLVTKIESL